MCGSLRIAIAIGVAINDIETNKHVGADFNAVKSNPTLVDNSFENGAFGGKNIDVFRFGSLRVRVIVTLGDKPSASIGVGRGIIQFGQVHSVSGPETGSGILELAAFDIVLRHGKAIKVAFEN